MTRTDRFALLCGFLMISLMTLGCGDVTVRRSDDGGIIITLGQPGGGGGGDEDADAPGAPDDSDFADEGEGAEDPEAENPPDPDRETPPPEAEETEAADDDDDTPLEDMSVSQGIDEIEEKYGIRITGGYTEGDIAKLLISARQYRPNETAGVTINYSKGNSTSGVMGWYMPSGQMQIYDHKNLHTVFHELTHHITLYPRNTRARGIAEEVARMTPPEDGTLAEVPANYIPRSYARTNMYEYWAEFFSYLREVEKGIRGGYPTSRAFINPGPAEEVRQVARQIYRTP